LVSDQQLGGRRRAAGGRAMLPRRRGLESASCLGHGLARRRTRPGSVSAAAQSATQWAGFCPWTSSSPNLQGAMAAGRKGWAASLLGS
jgi:hypothetical protein